MVHSTTLYRQKSLPPVTLCSVFSDTLLLYTLGLYQVYSRTPRLFSVDFNQDNRNQMAVLQLILLILVFSHSVDGGASERRRSLHVLFTSKGQSGYHGYVAKNIMTWLETRTQLPLALYELSITHIIQKNVTLVLQNPSDYTGMKISFCHDDDPRRCVVELIRDRAKESGFLLAIAAEQLPGNELESYGSHLRYVNFRKSVAGKESSDILLVSLSTTASRFSGEDSIDSLQMQNLSQSSQYTDEDLSLISNEVDEVIIDDLDWPVTVTQKYLRSTIESSADFCHMWWPLPGIDIFILDHSRPQPVRMQSHVRCQLHRLIPNISKFSGSINARIIANGREMEAKLNAALEEFKLDWIEIFSNGVEEYTCIIQIESIETDPITGATTQNVLAYFEVSSSLVYGSRIAYRDRIRKEKASERIYFPGYHSILSELPREDGFPFLLNSLGLTGTAVEGILNPNPYEHTLFLP